MTEFDLKAYLDEKVRLVEQVLEQALPCRDVGKSRLIESMRYSLLAPGKRLRPVLCLAGAEAVGAGPEIAMPAAMALEMIHAYSLIHDDLPAMDNDDLRRGRPTNHIVFGQGLAVLAGDGLLTLAFEILARAGLSRPIHPERVLKTIMVIAEAAGYQGMVGGQALDLALEGQAATEHLVTFLHSNKTGALITAAVTSGAIMAGANPDQLNALQVYGRKIGLAFQIIDDILDIEGETEVLGKKVGADQNRAKTTYPGVVGGAQAKSMAQQLVSDAIKALDDFGAPAEPLRVLGHYLLTRKK